MKFLLILLFPSQKNRRNPRQNARTYRQKNQMPSTPRRIIYSCRKRAHLSAGIFPSKRTATFSGSLLPPVRENTILQKAS